MRIDWYTKHKIKCARIEDFPEGLFSKLGPNERDLIAYLDSETPVANFKTYAEWFQSVQENLNPEEAALLGPLFTSEEVVTLEARTQQQQNAERERLAKKEKLISSRRARKNMDRIYDNSVKVDTLTDEEVMDFVNLYRMDHRFFPLLDSRSELNGRAFGGTKKDKPVIGQKLGRIQETLFQTLLSEQNGNQIRHSTPHQDMFENINFFSGQEGQEESIQLKIKAPDSKYNPDYLPLNICRTFPAPPELQNQTERENYLYSGKDNKRNAVGKYYYWTPENSVLNVIPGDIIHNTCRSAIIRMDQKYLEDPNILNNGGKIQLSESGIYARFDKHNYRVVNLFIPIDVLEGSEQITLSHI
jgi:hypothetical protein